MNHEAMELTWDDKVTLGVVLASEGYPAGSTKDAVITGCDEVDALVYHMGTAKKDDKAYHEVAKIQCEKLFHRHDIGKKDM